MNTEDTMHAHSGWHAESLEEEFERRFGNCESPERDAKCLTCADVPALREFISNVIQTIRKEERENFTEELTLALRVHPEQSGKELLKMVGIVVDPNNTSQ